jgi:hypothetical protein
MLLAMNATVDESATRELLLDPPDDADFPLGGPVPLDEGESEGPDSVQTGADSTSEDIVFGQCGIGKGCDYRPMKKGDQKKYQALFFEIAHPLFGTTEAGTLFSVFGVEKTPSGNPCFTGRDAYNPWDPRNLVFKTKAGGENGERLLTDFKTLNDGSVSRIKLATIEPGRNLIMYEVWKGNDLPLNDEDARPLIYDGTKVMIVDDSGETLAGPWTPDLPHRVLSHQDELTMINGKLVFYDGSGSEIQRYTLTHSESTCVQTTDWAAVHKEKDKECTGKGLAASTEVVPPSNTCTGSTCKADYRGLDCDGGGCVTACTRCA